MKKLNNKGTTLVELIVSFSLVMVILMGMIGIITSLKKDAEKTSFESEMSIYKNTMTVLLQQDVIKEKITSINPCSDNNLICYNLNTENNTKQIIIDKLNKVIRYQGLIYEVPNKNDITIGDIFISLEDNILTIKIPIMKNDINYGINIVSITDI